MRVAIFASALIAAFAGSPARAQTTDLDALLAEIKCQDFSKHPDGYWTSGPKTKIGAMQLPNSTFIPGMVKFGDVDVAEVLEQKCARPVN